MIIQYSIEEDARRKKSSFCAASEAWPLFHWERNRRDAEKHKNTSRKTQTNIQKNREAQENMQGGGEQKTQATQKYREANQNTGETLKHREMEKHREPERNTANTCTARGDRTNGIHGVTSYNCKCPIKNFKNWVVKPTAWQVSLISLGQFWELPLPPEPCDTLTTAMPTHSRLTLVLCRIIHSFPLCRVNRGGGTPPTGPGQGCTPPRGKGTVRI